MDQVLIDKLETHQMWPISFEHHKHYFKDNEVVLMLCYKCIYIKTLLNNYVFDLSDLSWMNFSILDGLYKQIMDGWIDWYMDGWCNVKWMHE